MQHPASNWCWAPLRLALHNYVAPSGPPYWGHILTQDSSLRLLLFALPAV